MQISLPQEIYGEYKISIDPSKNVHCFIGPNGSGKTKLMDNIKGQIGTNKVKIIAENYNTISKIAAMDVDQQIKELFQNKAVGNTSSFLNANEILRKIVFHWFKKLFNKTIIKKGNQYWITEEDSEYQFNMDGDGYKSFFNLIYFLSSTEYDHIIFDEPERYLHPNLQISLLNMVIKLSESYSKQVYFITHNQNFVDLLSDNVETFLLSKYKKEAYNISDIIDTAHGSQFRTWIHYNKHILFSKSIVLLEGYSDQIFLNHLFNKLNFKSFARNVTFISVSIINETGGKSKIYDYQNIISKFYDCWALYDLDMLLDTGGELRRYISGTKLNDFKTALNSNGISDKNQLKSFYNNTSNDLSFIRNILSELMQNHKVLVLEKGEIEEYCITTGTDKLSDKLYEEVDYISSSDLSTVQGEYAELIDYLRNIDPISDSSITEIKNLAFTFIMKFFAEANLNDQYEWESISDQLKSHLVNDPDSKKDDNFRFIFKFLNDYEFKIPKRIEIPDVKETISKTLLP